jgi:hypothetical protein
MPLHGVYFYFFREGEFVHGSTYTRVTFASNLRNPPSEGQTTMALLA